MSGHPKVVAGRFRVEAASCEISSLFLLPPAAESVLVLGHGAGAGMAHPFLDQIAALLAVNNVATFRYQFPYMERGRRMPDRPPVLIATVRAAVQAACEVADGLPLFAGGKSLGGRITSLAAAEESLPEVRGLVFLAFPLHSSGKVSVDRAKHLAAAGLPMLFMQGTRDKLADLHLLAPVCQRLGATLHVISGADHSFSMLKRSGRSDSEVRTELAEVIARWMALRASA